jgi:serine/threonine-protein kinase
MAMEEDDKTRITPEPAATAAGIQLSGIYELDERIASGGMGEVFRGHNIQTGDKVAIKIVLPEFARDQTILALFRKEASILNHLSHDAVVRYHVFTIDPGIQRPYLAMEFVDGDALFDIIRRGPMAPEEVRRLLHRLALGLASVHEAGAVHRDLSPDNIILPGGRVDRAKIIDFGIARSSHVGGETLIGGKFAGKYNYVSPEQLGLNGGEVSDKSDIYSLGLVIAAALLGKPLEMSGSQLDIVEKRRAVPDLSEIDEEFRPIIEAMLQPAPRDRPTSAELAEMTSPAAFGIEAPGAPRTVTGDLGRAERPTSFVAHRRPELGRAGSVPPARQPGAAATSAASGPLAMLGGRRNLAIAGGGALLVALALVAYLTGILSFKDPNAAPPPEAATTLTPAEPPAPAVAEAPKPAEPAAPEAAQPAEAPPPQDAAAGAAKPESATEVAAAVPAAKPALPPTVDPAKVADWVEAHDGGACTYAAAAATPTSITLSGFGSSAAAFDQMAAAVQSEFGLQPQLAVQAIEPAQCAVPAFLRTVAGTGEAPHLTLQQSAVRDGTPVSGTLTTAGDGNASVFLVDHKGRVFNLTERFDLLKPQVDFSIPIGLAAADKAAGRALPQMIVAVSGTRGIDAANFTRPVAADQLFPAIAEELKAQGRTAAAAVQVFQLGG